MQLLSPLALTFGFVLLSVVASAQTTAGITGVARDTTGAVLPGVAVEAASPALIEKVRAVVTDAQGRYAIVDLRPGTYSVTFTLSGFATVRREGIELSAGFTAAVNAEMRVGAVEETITVTGASPVVDTQSVRTQQVMKTEVLEALPSGQRDLTAYASLMLGAVPTTAGRNDVGGNMGESNSGIALHGGRGDDGRINYDGMNTNVFYSAGGGQHRTWKFNTLAVQEIVVDTGGSSAETETGAANLNAVPRDGANRFTVRAILNYTNEDLSSGKVSDALIARGSARESNSLKRVFDYGAAIGGPIVRDRLWFYEANRWWGGQAYAANNFFNKSTNPFVYVPDRSRPAYSDFWQYDIGSRFTWQAAAKHKINTSLNGQRGCGCWLGISSGQRASPEAATSYEYGLGKGMYLWQTGWSYPATNRWLFQATTSFLFQGVHFTNAKFPGPNDISITEQTSGYTWGALPGLIQGGSYDAPHHGDNFGQRASVSYVSGSHAFKTGVQTLQGVYDIAGDARPNGVNYIFRLGQPLLVRQFASPFFNNVRVRSVGFFAQDQWTINRLTLNLGVRYDHFWSYAKAITLPAGPFIGERSYPEVRDLPNYHDVTPRLGAAYDLFGNGRTAIKASWGRYVAGLGGGDARDLSPATTVFTSTDRLWNDNGDFVPDCDLKNLFANGECGTVNNLAFGQTRPTTRWADAARKGWGVREYSYQYSVALQHELRPGFGMTVAYHRNEWKNQQALINNALGVADFTPYCITAPTDTRLGEFSGRQVCGLYDEHPAKFGQRDAERVRWQDIPGSGDGPSDIFNGVDIAVNARFGEGGVLLGGITFGRSVFDYCWQNALPNVTQLGTPGATNPATPYGTLPRSEGYCKVEPDVWDGIGSQIKLQAIYPLPYDFTVSGSYKHLPGIPIPALYNASNAEAAATLRRDLSACRGATGTACTARVAVDVIPQTVGTYSGATAARLYDERINQIDLRLSRMFRVGRLRMQGLAELYNVFNIRPAQAVVTTYGQAWQLPFAILGGRLFKFGVQVDY